MSKRIRFDRTKSDSKGRNGYIGTTGINVVEFGDELFLEPITSRGINSEACRIVLPQSAITSLIAALAEIASCSSWSLPRTRSGGQALDHLGNAVPRRRSRGALSARSQPPQEPTQCLASS